MTEHKRTDEYSSKVSNPCKKFLSWNQDTKSFTYYDKEQKEDVVVPLPMKFIKLKELSTIKGWHNDSNSGIFSNEVVNLNNEELNVRAFKGGELVKGLYKDIKTKILQNGGHYVKSIYVVDGTGELLNISLKGSGVSSWSDFLEEKGRTLALDNWIIIEGAKDMKKGNISYSVPTFEYLKELSADESGEADTVYRSFMDYYTTYQKSSVNTKEEEGND